MSAPSLDHLRTFVAVVRAGSITRAAAGLGLAQATVSAQLQALESRLGERLLDRGPAGVTPTARGAELVRLVDGPLDALAAIGLGAESDAASAVRPLFLGGAAETLSTLVLPRLGELVEAVGAPVHVAFGLAEPLLDELLDRRLDLVLSAVRPARRGVGASPLFDEEFELVCAPAWAQTPLADIPLLAYAAHLPIVRRYWRTVFGRRPEGLRLVAVVPDLRELRDAAVRGLGMTVVPRYLLGETLADGRLVRRHETELPPLNTVYLAARGRELEREPRIAAASAWLRAALAEPAGRDHRYSDRGHR